MGGEFYAHLGQAVGVYVAFIGCEEPTVDLLICSIKFTKKQNNLNALLITPSMLSIGTNSSTSSGLSSFAGLCL